MKTDNEYDNQSQSGRRIKPHGKRRKHYTIECRWARELYGDALDSIASVCGLYNWWVYSRYTTKDRRDQAYAALVKKSLNEGSIFKGHTEWRIND